MNETIPEFQLSIYPLEYRLGDGTGEICAVCHDEYKVQREASYKAVLQIDPDKKHQILACFLHTKAAMNGLMARQRVVWCLEEVTR